MALNIQWNFAKPESFSNINSKENDRQNAAYALGQTFGTVHDMLLDSELADMLNDEGNEKRIVEIDARIAEIDAELAKLEPTLNVVEGAL